MCTDFFNISLLWYYKVIRKASTSSNMGKLRFAIHKHGNEGTYKPSQNLQPSFHRSVIRTHQYFDKDMSVLIH